MGIQRQVPCDRHVERDNLGRVAMRWIQCGPGCVMIAMASGHGWQRESRRWQSTEELSACTWGEIQGD